MNKQIKELALQAGFPQHWTTDDDYLIEKWEKFAALVAAHEREACIKLVNEGTGEPIQTKTLFILQKERKRIADAITARR